MTSRNELKNILRSYNKNWNVWIDSAACFLNPFEIALIEESISDRAITECASKFGISEFGFITSLIKITYKLKIKYKFYKDWTESLFIEDHYLTTEEMLLNAPIHLLPVSQELKQWLFYTHLPNILGVVETYSEMDLIVLYEFPEHILFELKKCLGQEQSCWFGGLKKKSKVSTVKQKPLRHTKSDIKIHLN